MKRYDLTDEQLDKIKDYFERQEQVEKILADLALEADFQDVSIDSTIIIKMQALKKKRIFKASNSFG